MTPVGSTLAVFARRTPSVAVNDATAPGGHTADSRRTGRAANDHDADGDPFTRRSSRRAHAPWRSSPTAFTYTPTAEYNGPDSFTYKLNDGRLDSNAATVNIDVGVFNHAPVANNDSYAPSKGTALQVSAALGVLANDTDQDHNPLTAQVVSYPSHGSLSLQADGSFTYTPSGPTWARQLHLSGLGRSAFSTTATMQLNITGQNDPPVAQNDSYLVLRTRL